MGKIIVSNMKMNLSLEEIKEYIANTKELQKKENVIICPSSIYIPYFIEKHYNVGIQDISRHNNGAYTGDISSNQASSIGIKYAIVGHSERRNYQKETNEDVNEKIKNALKNDITCIMCVGEDNKTIGINTKEFLKEEILEGLKGITNFDKIIIAYEPIWSIGTGLVPTNDDIDDVCTFIKDVVKKNFHKDVKILYGGSVNEKNVDELIKVESVSGFLIGGSSLVPTKLKKIVEIAG